MEVRVLKDTKYLIANPDHKNFTESGEMIEEGSVLKGEPKAIQGLRRGEPFVYRLFITEEGKILYLNNIEPMKTVEVTLGADAQRTPTTVNLLPAETFSKMKTAGLIIGGLAGFAYAKSKKHDMKKVAMFIAVGAAVGFGAGYVFDRNRKVVVTQSK
jgi:hypothetical protein